MKKMLFISTLFLIMAGCFPGEDRLSPVQPVHDDLSIYPDSSGYVYYSLRDRKVVSVRNMYDWDLAFESRSNGFNIVLNSGKKMKYYNTRIPDFRITVSVDDLPWEKDEPCSDLQLMCIGEWGDFGSGTPLSHRWLYILDLGYDQQGYHQGYKKFYVAGIADGKYLVRYSDPDGKNEILKLIDKDETTNFTYFTFKNGGEIVNIEPPAEEWDIVFTKFVGNMDQAAGPLDEALNGKHGLFYGILSNPKHVQLAVDSMLDWEDINYFDSKDFKYTRNTDLIGKNWYRWDAAFSRYQVKYRNYFLKDGESNIYLLRFDSFSHSKEKSTISFQFKNL